MANELSMARPYVDVYGALEEGRQRAVARRQEEEANALSQAIRAASARAVRNGMVDPRLLGEELAQSGYAYAIPGAQEKLFATMKGAGEAAEAAGKGEAARIKALSDKFDLARQQLPIANPSRLEQWVKGVYADPDLAPIMQQYGTLDEVLAELPADAAGRAKWMQAASMIPEEYMKRYTTSAAEELTAATQRRGQDITAATTRRGQDIERATKEREQNLARFFGTAGAGTEDRKVVARTETAADGTVRFYNKFGDLLKTEKGAGKPSATFERTKATREQTQRDLSGALATLKEVVKPGGLIEQSTGSGAGRAFDIAAGFIGEAPQGAIAIGKLQPLADQILKLVPRFEGPQSDKDTQSYKEAAGQLANPTLPREIRKAAANTLIGLFEKRKNQFTTAGAEAETGGDWQDL